MMKDIIVLAMHGAPPRDFPRAELGEFMSLHGRLEAAPVSHSPALESRYEELEKKMREWPRTAENDPFYASSQEIAAELQRISGKQIMLGFNEFCAPTLDEALERAASSGAERIFIVTPMMTRGGEHSEKDIRQAVVKAQQKHPGVKCVYTWPFETSEIAGFLATHIRMFENT
jgi:sirohydrochlorin cobaltochelatase